MQNGLRFVARKLFDVCGQHLDLEGHLSSRIMFAIGDACKGEVDSKKRTLFGKTVLVKEAKVIEQAVALFDQSSSDAKEAIDCFLIVAKRNNVVGTYEQ